MISISLSLKEEQLRLALDALRRIPKGAEKAIARSVNRALEGARTDAIKTICAEYAIKPSEVRKTFHIIRASAGKLTGQIISAGGPIPLIKFNVKPKKPPNQKDVKIGRRRTVVAGVKFGNAVAMPHSFVAQMKSGHIGVFARKSGSRTIKQHYSPAVPQMLGNKDVLKYIEEQAHERLDKELRHQISYLFNGGR
ncbi:hypothetical protein FACS1894216_02560 [Synergistales bacterium]|nr:hypothetical protein FACS1894216_02560 [Synergistales bacterium]